MHDQTADRLAIADTLYRYAEAIDLLGAHPVGSGEEDPALPRAVEILRTCLTDDGIVRLAFHGPGSELVQAGDGGSERFAPFVRQYFTDYGYIGTYHLVGNVRITFDGSDTADVKSYINTQHWMADGRNLAAPIVYEDRVVRGDDGLWRIRRRDIVVLRWWVTEGWAAAPNDPTLARPGARATA
jgi:hypothetical protein